MKTVRQTYEYLGFTRDTFYSVLLDGTTPTGFSGVATFCVDNVHGRGTLRVRVLYDRGKIIKAIKDRAGLQLRGDEARDMADALTYCDGSCDGCRANDGSGCDAIALFASHDI